MSDEREPPPRTVVTDLHPAAQLTRAVTTRGEIRFEILVPENHHDPDLAEGLRCGFYGELSLVPGQRFGPITVDVDERTPSKILVVYKPDRPRKPGQDMARIVKVFEELEIPVTESVAQGIQHAFDALKTLNARGPGSAVAAEVARRTAKKGPPGRGSR